MKRGHGVLLLLLAAGLGSLLFSSCGPGQGPGSPTPIVGPTAGASQNNLSTPAFPSPAPSPTSSPAFSPTAATITASPEDLQFSFAVAGDSWKDNSVFREIIARANSEGDAFIVIVGDITPQGLPEQYQEFENVIAASEIPVYAVPGNHDILNGGLQEFLKLYPQRYSFDRGRAHFAMVDNSQGGLSEADFHWLEDDLSMTTQPLKFVFAHIPPFLPSEGQQGEVRVRASAFTGLMAKSAVSYVFSGDLHAFRRLTQDGVNYIITGGAGSPLHLPPALGGYYHFVKVTVGRNKVTDEVVRVEGTQ